MDSVNIFEEAIRKSQIIMFPGGFSAGDEPDGSAKFSDRIVSQRRGICRLARDLPIRDKPKLDESLESVAHAKHCSRMGRWRPGTVIWKEM